MNSIEFARSVKSRFSPESMKWHYQDGLMMKAFLDVADAYDLQKEFYPYVISCYENVISSKGEIKGYVLGEYNLDQVNAAKILDRLDAYASHPQFIAARDTIIAQLKAQPRTSNGIYWHKGIYPHQVWLDGQFMAGPFNATYICLRDAVEQLMKTAYVLKDSSTGLYYHAWDQSKGMRWSDPSTGCSPNFWARAIGWYLTACIDVGSRTNHFDTSLSLIVTDLCKTLLRYADKETGLWFQVVDKPNAKGNYLETSASAMFIYDFLRATQLGLMDLRLPAIKALESLIQRRLSFDGTWHLDGICSVAGLGGYPYRDGSLAYYLSEPVVKDDFKGTGPFLFALLEAERSGLRR